MDQACRTATFLLLPLCVLSRLILTVEHLIDHIPICRIKTKKSIQERPDGLCATITISYMKYDRFALFARIPHIYLTYKYVYSSLDPYSQPTREFHPASKSMSGELSLTRMPPVIFLPLSLSIHIVSLL